MPGEFDFIDWIKTQQRPSELVSVPAGDDLAVLNWPNNNLLLVGVDQVLDGAHFDSAQHRPRQIGKKVMNRNLSDCAAMACLPVAAVVSVALHKGTPMEYAQELYLGLKEAADPFNCAIVGGDTAAWDGKLALSVAIMGRSDGIEPITRANAQPGDGIYVTGPLGGSILGRHMDFFPRVQLGRQLAQHMPISAMIDLSDGLSRDLGQICRSSGVGAVLDANLIPVHADAVSLGHKDGRTPLEHALHDGEDYELLYTTSASVPSRAGVRIGTITTGSLIYLEDATGRRPLSARGWEHTF